jgi:isopentenyl-diphosphate delta-isomerase
MKKVKVILVNEEDQPVGEADKMEAHRQALLHRAFSVFIFNSRGEMLLQQRALHKYHSGGLWSNACCSHPVPGEDTAAAANRRLSEEMGIVTKLDKLFHFIYRADFENELTEYELDHVFAGEYDGEVNLSPDEAADCCYKDMKDLEFSMRLHPQKYTAWFHLAFPKVKEWWDKQYGEKRA